MSSNNQNKQNNNQNSNKTSNFDKKNDAFGMPNFEMPNVEVPAALRDMAEKTIAQTKENYDRMKVAAEETTEVMETAYAAYSKGASQITAKLLDNTQAHVNALFDFAKSLTEVKTVAEAVEKQTSFARTQFEALTAQGREIQELSTKIANDTSAPVKAAAEKAGAQFKKMA